MMSLGMIKEIKVKGWVFMQPHLDGSYIWKVNTYLFRESGSVLAKASRSIV